VSGPVESPTGARYVSRGALKLEHALDAFGLNPAGRNCADLGCSTGGFTDCLLQRGAASVVCVDTGYGVLDYRLRTDPRVTVLERSNALHTDPTRAVDLVVIDLGWTPQRLALPVALRWLGENPAGRIITLIKPHYERSAERGGRRSEAILDEAEARDIVGRVLETMPDWGAVAMAVTRSPITGGKGKSKGNAEWLALVAPAARR
jgi:23S rRNA (cytidine1920-2'-O)/16S rRNA (cytidine1409-2'-O)-methyltransferase